MIVTLTLSPAIDKTTEVQQLIPEKKMRCAELIIEPGGGGINVSKAIHELEGKTMAMFLCGGANGKELSRLLHEGGLHSIPVEVSGNTRENFVVNEISTNKQFRFVMPGAMVSEQEIASVKKVINSLSDVSFLVCSGSLPPGIGPQFLEELAAFAKERSIKFVVDTSGPPLKAAAKKGVYLLKPNLTELGSLAGKDYLEHSEIAEAAKKVIEEGSCEVLVVSMGPSGAMLVTQNGTKQFKAPVVKKQSTVGAGDSMVAGIIWMLEQQKTIEDAVQFGIACGTAATINKGTRLFKKEDAFRFYDWIKQDSQQNTMG